ncbi:MAG: rhodanese-like domain-containing protein [Defluviitaleaceae bacterium]|nr:rhodanese-like domain-containing protein [Defluviitaleaceae bacterium]
MKILIIDEKTAGQAHEDILARNIQGADIVLVDTAMEKLAAIDGNTATLEEVATGRLRHQQFDILVAVQPFPVGGDFGDVLQLKEGGCPKLQWRRIERFLRAGCYAAATIAGDCISSAQAAINLYTNGVMPTIVTTTSHFPKGFDRDISTYFSKQLKGWGIAIQHTYHPYLPQEAGRATLFFGDHLAEQRQTHRVLAPALVEKFGSERALAVLATVKRCLVPQSKEGALSVSAGFLQAATTGTNEGRLVKTATNYIYSVLPVHAGFIKLIYGACGKIYGFSAIGSGAEGFVDIMTTIITQGGSVHTLANAGLISNFGALVKLGKIALAVINRQIRMAYADEVAEPSNGTILLDVRNQEEFADGHAANSINVPVADIKYATHLLENAWDIITISGKGERAQDAARFLTERGYKARILTGGLDYFRMVEGGI